MELKEAMQWYRDVVFDNISPYDQHSYQCYDTILNILLEKEERENQRPMRLYELEEINDEPVWIVDIEFPENTGWVIWDAKFTETWITNGYGYGTQWWAYRFKPVEKSTC